MVKDDAIVILEATEIMQSLPTAMQKDDQIMDSVITSLQQGQSMAAVRMDALEIAHMKLEKTVTHGFALVNQQFVKIQHEAEKDRIHAEYARKQAQEAADKAEKAYQKAQQAEIQGAKAEAKADGARDEAKRANRFVFADPLLVMIGSSILIVSLLALFTRFQVVPEAGKSSDQTPSYVCGRDLACNIPMQPANNSKGGV